MDEPRFSVDQDWLVRIRRELHAHPEIGWELENTVRVVRRELDAIGIPYEVDRYGRNTIVATVNPEIPSFTLGLRADMDALPIQEKNFDKPYRSRIDGAMHACGHDAHTAMLLGACRALYGMREKLRCRVKLLFQPCEESRPSGARTMCEHGVMDERLPDGTRLKPDWALQHPDDYLKALETAVPQAVKNAGIDKNDVVGIGIDFTACTVIPIDKAGNPMCWKYPSNPHAYVKLWKHHAAQDQANRLNAIAEARGEKWLKRYGGKISSEWMFPKLWQIAEEDPALYAETDRYMEAGDWVILRLTGVETHNSCMAGYKAIWHKKDGYPSKEFLKACHPLLENVVEEKLGPVTSIGSKAGELTKEMAEKMGLKVVR